MSDIDLHVHVHTLSADEAEAAGHDSTLRSEVGPAVRVVFTDADGEVVDSRIAVLKECRVEPEHLDEV